MLPRRKAAYAGGGLPVTMERNRTFSSRARDEFDVEPAGREDEIRRRLGWLVKAAAISSGADCAGLCVMDASGARWVTECEETDLAALGNPWAHEALIPVLRGDTPVVNFSDLQLEPPADGTLQKLLPIRSALAVPVSGGDELYGLLVIGDRRPDAFGDEAAAELSVIGGQAGILIDNWTAQSRLSELETLQRAVVHQLQEALRPPVPAVPHTELGVWYVAAEPGPTGGDLYDWMMLPDGDLHLAVVDVAGKGVSASKDALTIIHALRMLALDGCPLNELIARTDRLASAQDPDLAATAVVARYRPDTGEVRIVGAGHPPVLIVSGDAVQELPVGGVPIGWPGARSDGEIRVVLDRFDVLVLYTDGLVEATKDIIHGLESLRRAAVKTAPYPAPYLARALVEAALADAKWQDDTLALVLRRRTPPADSPAPLLGPFEYRFSPLEASVPLARHTLADWLARLPVEPGEAEDVLIIASELCTNAVHHGGRTVVLRAAPAGNDLVLEVEDDGGTLEWPERHFGQLPDAESDRGRGLFLVEALADEVTSLVENGRSIVRCVKRAIVPAHDPARRPLGAGQ